MGLFKLFFVLLMGVGLPLESAVAETPLRDRAFLMEMLNEIGFNRTSAIDVTIRGGQISDFDSDGARMTSESAAGLFLDIGLIDISPRTLRENQSNIGAQSYWVQTVDGGSAELREVIARIGFNPIIRDGSSIGYMKYARRTFEGTNNIWEFRDWTENNIEYAVVDGYYRILNLFSGTSFEEVFPFKVLVERNPASGRWTRSTYRGVSSSLARGDKTLIDNWMNGKKSYFARLYANAISEASAETERRVLNTGFSNYRRVGNILQIDLEGDKYLIDLRPQQYLSQPDGIAYCESLTAGGYNSWQLPEQWTMAYLLAGYTFDSWPRTLKLKDTPNGRFWGSALRALSTGAGNQNLITRSNTGEDRVQRVYIIDLNPPGTDYSRRPYTSFAYHYFYGESVALNSGNFDTYRAAVNAFCVNSNVEDNLDFALQ